MQSCSIFSKRKYNHFVACVFTDRSCSFRTHSKILSQRTLGNEQVKPYWLTVAAKLSMHNGKYCLTTSSWKLIRMALLSNVATGSVAVSTLAFWLILPITLKSMIGRSAFGQPSVSLTSFSNSELFSPASGIWENAPALVPSPYVTHTKSWDEARHAAASVTTTYWRWN